MSRRESAVLLWDLVASIDAIASFLQGTTREQFIEDPMLRAAVERHLITIGEVFVRMGPDSETAKRLGVPARQIVGMRNALVHGYDRIDDSLIYSAARDDLISLRTSAVGELDRLNGTI